MTGEYNPYTLPTIDFVGGETQDLVFNLFFYKNKRPFSTTGVSANFAIVSFTNKMGTPILTKPMEGAFNDEGTINNVLTVTLEPSETVGLNGKYIYQIQIRDIDGDVEIPKQGILYITNNINKNFIR